MTDEDAPDRATGPKAASSRAGAPEPHRSLDRVATVPNLISLARILLIPVVVVLLIRRGTEAAGLILLGVVVSTDWVDGQIARRTGQVSNLGKVLDPVADRLVLAAALVALVVRGAFPLWAALPILIRDGLIVVVGGIFMARTGVRIEVRWVGKVATGNLMAAIPLVAWGNLDLPLATPALVLGWTGYVVGLALYAVATAAYVIDARRALARRV